MPYYRVLLHGGNIRIEPESRSALRLVSASAAPIEGFYTHRFVRALNRDRAIAAAILSVEKELAGYKISIGGKPVFDCEEIEQIDFWSYLFGKPRRGFTFYNEPSN